MTSNSGRTFCCSSIWNSLFRKKASCLKIAYVRFKFQFCDLGFTFVGRAIFGGCHVVTLAICALGNIVAHASMVFTTTFFLQTSPPLQFLEPCPTFWRLKQHRGLGDGKRGCRSYVFVRVRWRISASCLFDRLFYQFLILFHCQMKPKSHALRPDTLVFRMVFLRKKEVIFKV